MTSPAPVIAQPDLEAWVWAQIKDLPGVTSFVYSSVTDWPHWQVAYSVQIDARAKGKQLARDLAETVRQRIVALPGLAWPDGAVTYSTPVEGPFWLPDDDGGPRYCARYEIRAHPPRTVPSSLMTAARAARTDRKD